jgi:uncharacterized protein YjbJ (UPF0337 family)
MKTRNAHESNFNSIHGGGRMNKDRVKGAMDQSLGSAKREAGKLAGMGELELEGIAQQVKGKLESALGEAEDVIQIANEEAVINHESRIDVEMKCSAIESKEDIAK